MENKTVIIGEKIVRETIKKYKMQWNFESIDFVLNTENVSFDNLENADAGNKNLRLIIQCGLPSHDKSEAFKIMDEIREAGVSPKIAHFAFVEVLKTKHFFSDTSERAEIIKLGLERLEHVLQNRSLNNA